MCVLLQDLVSGNEPAGPRTFPHEGNGAQTQMAGAHLFYWDADPGSHGILTLLCSLLNPYAVAGLG